MATMHGMVEAEVQGAMSQLSLMITNDDQTRKIKMITMKMSQMKKFLPSFIVADSCSFGFVVRLVRYN